MNRLEIIETLLHWLMWISLGALLLIAAACAYVGLRRVSQVLYARLRPAAIGVFAVAAIIATGEAQKRLLRDGALGDRALPGKTADVGECVCRTRPHGAVQRAD